MASPDVRSLPDPAERWLRRVVAARGRNDREAMMAAWEEFLVVELGRVRNRVRLRRVPEHDVDDVTGRVFLKVRQTALRGSTIGEARALVREATDSAIVDYFRGVSRHDRHRGAALDGTSDRDLGLVAAAELELGLRATSDVERVHLRDALKRAMEQVDENKRDVVRLRLQGYDGDEVAQRLGLSRANVDQRFKRGREQLKSALESLL
ncbi:MAG: sigma-70 family RNA polymerase sigma factor [Solirubrobacteraceae bacterium]|nr:sigma-70 family RNA polymerase sigma factor [Solirubrobacteraceae bacterium]